MNAKTTKDILARLERLEKAVFNSGKSKSVAKTADTKSTRPAKVDFGLNEKNFVKTYAKGLSGPKKFTLLLAHMTKGKTGADIEVGAISSKWNKMKAKNLLGYTFNGKYPNEAVTQGWVDSKKYGFYHLRQGWMDIFD